jgi:hypothetical protein
MSGKTGKRAAQGRRSGGRKTEKKPAKAARKSAVRHANPPKILRNTVPKAAPPARGRPAPGKSKTCREPGCSAAVTARGFCRLHYIKNWKAIRASDRRAAQKRMTEYVDELIHKVPSDYEDREERPRPPPRSDLDFGEARDDVEEMFREMGFEEEV